MSSRLNRLPRMKSRAAVPGSLGSDVKPSANAGSLSVTGCRKSSMTRNSSSDGLSCDLTLTASR